MEIARTIEKTGDLSFLVPGAEDISSVSFELMTCLNHSFRIISWQDNLRTKEMPPKWMWPHTEELEEWFDEVDTLRRQEYGIEDDSWDEGPEMSQNSLSARFKD